MRRKGEGAAGGGTRARRGGADNTRGRGEILGAGQTRLGDVTSGAAFPWVLGAGPLFYYTTC